MIRNNVPMLELNADQLDIFHSLLNTLKNKLQPVFSTFLQIDTYNTPDKAKKEIRYELRKLIEKEDYILISANSSKKILKNIGFNPLKLIVSGGPLIFNDYSKVNPNIPEDTLEGIKKKCKKVINQLKNIDWRDSNVIFIYEKKNKTDQIILDELNEIKKVIGKDIDIFEISDWKDLDA